MTALLASPTLDKRLRAAQIASRTLATVPTGRKDAGLEAIALAIETAAARILPANELDLANGREAGLSVGLQDRLRLDQARLTALAAAVREIIALPDPVGDVVRGSTLPNGVTLSQVRVPFGVIGAIYEARPNVTIDIAALALKSGNATVLRGGTAAQHTNAVLVALIQEALESVGLPGVSGVDGLKDAVRGLLVDEVAEQIASEAGALIDGAPDAAQISAALKNWQSSKGNQAVDFSAKGESNRLRQARYRAGHRKHWEER